MSVNDLYTVEMRYLVDAKVLTSTYGYRATFAETPAALAASLARAFIADIIPEMLAVWTTDVELMSIYVLGINPTGRLPDEDHFEATTGSIVDDTYPNNRPYVIKQITDALNSKHNGRIYMSGFGHGNVTAQTLNLAFMTGPLQALLDVLVEDVVDPDEITRIWRPCVVNRVFEGIPVSPPLFSDVVQLTANATIFSQRRRITPRTNIAV